MKGVGLRQVPDGDSYEFIVWGFFFGGFFLFFSNLGTAKPVGLIELFS